MLRGEKEKVEWEYQEKELGVKEMGGRGGIQSSH